MSTHNIAVEQRHSTTVFKQQLGQDFGRSRFAGSAQSGEPDTEALFVPWWIGLRENLSYLRTREPRRQLFAPIKVLANLRARDCNAFCRRLIPAAFVVTIAFRIIDQFLKG